jgi:hypothetical protein
MDKASIDFVHNYSAEVLGDNAAVFVGAGLSKSAGFVDWTELLAPIAAALGLDSSTETNLVSLAQYHVNLNAANRHQLNQILIDQLSDLKAPTENHAILARLPIKTYWTTNYDRFLETALESTEKRVDVKYTNEQLAITKKNRDAIVYKMHGDIEHPNKAILTKDDYERYPDTHGPFITALSGDLVEKTFLFLGLSFDDPNLDYILGRIRARFLEHQRQHFYITKRRARNRREGKDNYERALAKQSLMIQDLLRFNIRTILVDDYSEITKLLALIEKRIRRRTIFISGSVTEYSPWNRPDVEDFVSRLAAALIERDYRIASGLGFGIGMPLITGAFQQIYSTTRRSIEEQLLLRPFPRGIKEKMGNSAMFSRYQRELIDQAGIALFIIGNREVNGRLVNASGVREEFEFSKSEGLYLIPVGASGSMAQELWKEVMTNIGKYFPEDTKTIRSLLAALGSAKRLTDLLNPILKLIDHLAKL